MDYSGQRFEHYQLIEKLGQGGMATVYKAYDTRLERDVAIKVVRKESIPPEQLERILKRFEREAKALAKFIHPNIVPVHDYGEYQGAPFLVMAYLPGGTLKERIGMPVPVQKALGYVLPIASALGYAHQRGVIHRDVKPGNILTTEDGALMLSDFGIAQILEEATTQLTATGMGVGTPEYMAPEQWQGQATAASDQYALGVVLYELLTGRKPFSAETPLAVALKVMSEPLPRPSDLVPEIPEGVEKVLYKALARDPQDRYEDMEALRKALQGFAARGSESPLMEKVQTIGAIADEANAEKHAGKPTESASEIERVGQSATPAEPEPAAPQASESVTQDALDATAVEELGPALQGKRGLPKWALWAGIGIAGLVIIGLAMGMGGRLATETATITPKPEPTLGIGSTMINAKDGAEMVYVPAGEFLMGSEDADAYDDETPEHTVYLDAYWIYKHEVTNAQYRQCIEDGVCSGDLNKYPENDYPAVDINWYEANDYCEWAGGRLPTEAQWEKAARGEDGRKYPWGNEGVSGKMANYCDTNCEYDDWKDGSQDDGYTMTAPVGSFPAGASPYGALDMAGNVWEWVADWYDENYYQNSPSQNPTGPSSGTSRVLRGGSWCDNERYLRASNRVRNYPGYSNDFDGFRCLSSP